MAYREPGVTVTQEFANAQPALATFSLPNVIVGPIFQVVRLASAGSYTGDEQQYGWAGKLAGALVDARPPRTDSPEGLSDMGITMTLKNTMAKILESSDATVAVGELNKISDATSGAFSGVKAEDKIVIASGALAGTYTVRAKIDDNTLQIKETFSAADVSISYEIRRNIGTFLVPKESLVDIDPVDGVTLESDLMCEVTGFGACPVKAAEVFISYRALRLENSSTPKEYESVTSLQEDFGLDQIVPENPAVFGAYLALSNSVTATNILGLKAEALTDEPMAYQQAFEILELSDMYAITVLSQSPAVHTLLKTHVEGMSVPSKKLERVGIINRGLILNSTVVASSSGSITAPGTTVNCPGATFITSGVVPGHFLKLTAPSQGRYKIAAVNSQTQLVLEGPGAGGAVASATFSIERDLTKTEQASVMAAYASSLGSRRLVMTYPDVVKIPVGNAIRELPGYFLNCAVGALTTGLPTQQGLTNLGVSLYSGVVHSTKYFNGDQLNSLADGGVMIFVQDVLDQTALYIRHQLTTDRSAVKFQEYSVTKNVDFIAKFIRSNHSQFIGQYNIVDGAFDDLKTNAKGIINFLTERTRQPKIGGVIRGGKLDKISQDAANIDAIVERYVLDIPIPLNNLDITIVV